VADDVRGSLRLCASRLEMTIPADDGGAVDTAIDIAPGTVHALRHLMAARVSAPAGAMRHCRGATIIDRALAIAGATIERIEVRPGDPPHLSLAIVSPTCRIERIDIDVVELAELASTRRIPVVAVGWPARDWDGALRDLTG
jgi:hypothetical protein